MIDNRQDELRNPTAEQLSQLWILPELQEMRAAMRAKHEAAIVQAESELAHAESAIDATDREHRRTIEDAEAAHSALLAEACSAAARIASLRAAQQRALTPLQESRRALVADLRRLRGIGTPAPTWLDRTSTWEEKCKAPPMPVDPKYAAGWSPSAATHPRDPVQALTSWARRPR